MKSVTLGSSGLEVSRLGLGCMGMSAFYTGSGQDDAAAIQTIHRAFDLGVTFYDTAEIYGPYTNEVLLGRAIADRREQVVIASKFGTIDHLNGDVRGLNGSPKNLRLAVEGSLKRLGTDYLDLYYQHRMDPETPIEETAGEFSKLIEEGKIRAYGLSEAAPATIRRAHAVQPVAALQTEYSLWSRDPEAEILPTLRELGIVFVPYSPLGRGFLTGAIRSLDQLDEADFRRHNPRFAGENLAANIRLVEQVDAVAAEAGATAAQIALAWLLAQGQDIVPIPGTKRIEYLEDNLGADRLTLGTDQLAKLNSLPAPSGERYAAEGMAVLNK